MANVPCVVGQSLKRSAIRGMWGPGTHYFRSLWVIKIFIIRFIIDGITIDVVKSPSQNL